MGFDSEHLPKVRRVVSRLICRVSFSGIRAIFPPCRRLTHPEFVLFFCGCQKSSSCCCHRCHKFVDFQRFSLLRRFVQLLLLQQQLDESAGKRKSMEIPLFVDEELKTEEEVQAKLDLDENEVKIVDASEENVTVNEEVVINQH
ncbi:uncharacterized protein LOC119768871 isoform X2 [Culex quinquefasciatus]|uniref:uncharacterized protein LOC119768871 isoform X2 n=1 Tax=Culex quinquefasciatus TaxID=7176 RepID=UPI0018E33605|nr:uncharacterized protein LOC119768871 isoform X2 [Culex quinquefasciatus]